MKILCKEIIKENLFQYDISSCYFNLMNSLGLEELPKSFRDDKELRNRKIGLIQKKNPTLSSYFISMVDLSIESFLQRNNINMDQIAVIQRDGFICSKILNTKLLSLPIRYEGKINKLIISPNRKSFLYNIDAKMYVKGILNKPYNLSFYNFFNHINYSSPKNICQSIEKIRQAYFKSHNIEYFLIPHKNSDFLVYLKGYDIIIERKSTNLIDNSEIDKLKYWKIYMWPFCQSIMNYYIPRKA